MVYVKPMLLPIDVPKPALLKSSTTTDSSNAQQTGALGKSGDTSDGDGGKFVA